jgi:flagellar motor switch protein FliG
MSTSTADKHGIRKAAIFVASLDRTSADRVLDEMAPEQARTVRQAIMELGTIDPREEREVLAEFRRRTSRAAAEPVEGVEIDQALAGIFVPPPLAPAARAPAERPAEPPFRFLCEAEVDKLVGVLLPERPQTVALVLSRMPPERAGNVLARLPSAVQVDVIRRLVDLEETDPEILAEVERGLKSRLSEQVRIERRRVAGLPAVAGILEACREQVGMEILDNVSLHDRSLAETLSPGCSAPSDVAELDDESLAVVLRAADAELTMLALVGALPPRVDRFLSLVPEDEAREIRRELAHLGPTRLSDVEEARRRLAELARRLAIEGRVRLPRKAPMAMA